jgi:hypothetical protein
MQYKSVGRIYGILIHLISSCMYPVIKFIMHCNRHVSYFCLQQNLLYFHWIMTCITITIVLYLHDGYQWHNISFSETWRLQCIINLITVYALSNADKMFLLNFYPASCYLLNELLTISVRCLIIVFRVRILWQYVPQGIYTRIYYPSIYFLALFNQSIAVEYHMFDICFLLYSADRTTFL